MKDGFADKSCGCGISDKILYVVCNCQGSAPAALWILFVCSKRAIKDKIYFGGSLKDSIFVYKMDSPAHAIAVCPFFGRGKLSPWSEPRAIDFFLL